MRIILACMHYASLLLLIAGLRRRYSGHTGPVYRIACSPFDRETFLSCSADWTVQLWSAKKNDKSVQTFHSVDLSDVVHDVAWSPSSSTIFGSVTGDGRIEIWDLSTSMLDPAVCMSVPLFFDDHMPTPRFLK